VGVKLSAASRAGVALRWLAIQRIEDVSDAFGLGASCTEANVTVPCTGWSRARLLCWSRPGVSPGVPTRGEDSAPVQALRGTACGADAEPHLEGRQEWRGIAISRLLHTSLQPWSFKRMLHNDD
jgi:hypothetical protein